MTENMWIQFVLPIVTLILGWLTSSYRNKQKKENESGETAASGSNAQKQTAKQLL